MVGDSSTISQGCLTDQTPLRNGFHIDVVTLDGFELPKFTLVVSSLGPKHPIRVKFNGVDVDRLVNDLKEKKDDDEKLYEIEMPAKWCAKNEREIKIEMIFVL